MWICGPKALACCLVIAGRGAGRGSRMTLKGESRPFGLLMIGAAVAVLAGCSTSDGSPITSVPPSSSSSLSSTSPKVTSTSSPSVVLSSSSAVPSSVTETKSSVTTASSPWPADLTPDQVASAQAAIAAYTAYWGVVDQAVADPGADWTSQISQYATGAKLDSFFESLRQAVARGQRATGTTKNDPQVTAVDPGLVTISDCVDKTYTDYLQGDVSIKAPDAPGSYFRHPAVVQVAQFDGGKWLVLASTDDWSKTC